MATGKRTLTDRLSPVQARRPESDTGARADEGAAEEKVGSASVADRAAQGGGPGYGGPIPFLYEIQTSFGDHDVGTIDSHVGGPAAEAAADIGATAYATGDKVAFAEQPDLHTAAHEAAHVVQQRGGVQLENGVGSAGDPYEQHADAVADRVVRGENAQALLDQAAPERGSRARSSAVQRKADEESTEAAGGAWDEIKDAAAAVVDLAQYGAGFDVGVLEGSLAAVRDLVMGAPDLFGLFYDLARSLVSEGLIGTAQSIGDKLVTLFKNAPELLRQAGDWFAGKWTQEDDFERGEFHGEVMGYILLQGVIAFVTAGSSAALEASGKFAGVIKVIRGLDAAGDIFTYARGASRAAKLPAEALARLRRTAGGAGDVVDAAADGAGDVARHATHAASPVPVHAVDPERPGRPHGADRPTTEAPDALPALRNQGEPYQDPRKRPHSPRRYLGRPELGSASDLHPYSSWKEAAGPSRLERMEELRKVYEEDGIDVDEARLDRELAEESKRPRLMALGKTLATEEEGRDVIAGLARGDASALRKIGIDDVPPDLDTTGREWALVETSDGFVVLAGNYTSTPVPVNVRPLAHSHPGPKPDANLGPGKITAGELPARGASWAPDEGPDGLSYDEILRMTHARGADRFVTTSGMLPSPGDIHAISDGGSHVIYTRFVHRGGGKIGNPVPEDKAPRVSLHLSGTKVVRWNPDRGEYWYEVNVRVQDSASQELWAGKMYSRHTEPGGRRSFSDDMSAPAFVTATRPPFLDEPLPPGWKEP